MHKMGKDFSFYKLIMSIIYIAGGSLAFGAILSAILNSVSLIKSDQVAYYAVIVLIVWVGLILYVKKYNPYWGDNGSVRIKKLNFKVHLFFVGVLITLCVPLLIVEEDKTDLANELKSLRLQYNEDIEKLRNPPPISIKPTSYLVQLSPIVFKDHLKDFRKETNTEERLSANFGKKIASGHNFKVDAINSGNQLIAELSGKRASLYLSVTTDGKYPNGKNSLFHWSYGMTIDADAKDFVFLYKLNYKEEPKELFEIWLSNADAGSDNQGAISYGKTLQSAKDICNKRAYIRFEIAEPGKTMYAMPPNVWFRDLKFRDNYNRRFSIVFDGIYTHSRINIIAKSTELLPYQNQLDTLVNNQHYIVGTVQCQDL